jgi:hypothetical protein
MGDFDLLREALARRRHSPVVPILTLQPDPILDLQDRLGNRGTLRLFFNGDTTVPVTTTTPASQSTPPTTTSPPANAPPANEAPTTSPTAEAPPVQEPVTTPAPTAATATPTPAPTIVTPSDIRAPSLLGLGNPLTNYLYNASDYSFAARGLGAANE